jgi:2,3-bisphosphoglycerate-dependent phosphoglycerate mutase
MDILAWADTRHLADLPPQPVYDQKKLVARPDKPSAA